MQEPAASILIVDDEVRNLRLIEALLRSEGYRTETSTCGEHALAAVAHSKPDLILLDVMMPGMSGFEVAGKLKLNEDTKSVPIIMVTSLDDRQSKLTALNMGAEEFITKPIDFDQLKDQLRQLPAPTN